ncbi:hypothetical protein [Streptomyces sp. NPDC046862]|uniref:hypothetical protein n=1 Tax=Streptomyces sp. NPDC046862 TaxID=3154603 RepID=UPI0034555ACD
MSMPTGFKQRLASELTAMATEPAPVPATRAPARGLRTRIALGAVVTAAAAAAVVVPTVSGTGGSPAYAVTRQDDGSLVLELNRAEGAPGLQKRLNSMGVRAAVLEGDDNCFTGEPPLAPGAQGRYPMSFDPEISYKASVHPALIHDGETLLVVAESRQDGTIRAISSRLVTKVPRCSVSGIGGGPAAHPE